MTKEFELEVVIQKQVFYNEEKMWGIYGFDITGYNTELERGKYGSYSMQGDTRKLAEGEKYNVKIEGSYAHPQYGSYYKIVSVEMEKLDSSDSQDKFLREILTGKQFEVLKETYPNEKLVDFILADKVDVSKTKGIKAHSLEKIKQNIEDNMQLSVLIAKLSELDISTSKLSKIVEYYKSPELALQAIETNIYSLCDIKSFGFKTVDEIALKRGDDPSNPKRIQAAILYKLREDNNEGHTWSIRDKLLESCAELLNMSMNDINKSLEEFPDTVLYQSNDVVAINYIRKKEQSILEHLLRIQKGFTAPSIKDIQFKIKETEVYQGFSFTDEQATAIIEGSQHGVMVLNGLAGSGKSATVKGLIDSLGTSNYMTAALSGKAVNVLSQRGIEASTIHRMLGFQDGGFVYTENHPLPYSVVVLDEVSMINVSLIHSVISAVPTGSKLIVVGDSGQLPAIGYGDVLRDLLATNLFPKYELTKVHRQAAKSGILSLANSIREGNQVFGYNESKNETFGELQDQTVISYHNKDAIPNDILNIARAYRARIHSPEDLYDFQVIVANRERGNLSVKNLNVKLQEIFNDLSKPALKRNGYEYREGDKIITQGNAYKKHKFISVQQYQKIMYEANYLEKSEKEAVMKKFEFDFFNGTLGYIDTIDTVNKLVFIRLDGYEGIIPLAESELDKIEMAYAATVHKLQGSSIKNVIFALDYGAYKLLSKQLVYTAMTRTSIKGVALVEGNALFTAIKNDASGLRRTFLQDMIKQEEAAKMVHN